MSYNPTLGRNQRTGSDNLDSLAIDTNNMSSQGVFAGLPWMQSLWDDLTGYNAATRDYQWQQYLLNYNTPSAQMERMKQAGINPNLAAQGISGGNMQNPSGNTGAAGQGAAALGSVAQAAQAAGNVATDFGMLQANQDRVKSETRLNLGKLGLTELESAAAEISLKFADQKEQAAVASIVLNNENIKQSHAVMVQQVENMKAQIEEINANIELAKSTKDYQTQLALESQKRALQIEADTAYQTWHNNICQTLGIDPKLPIANNILLKVAAAKGSDADSLMQFVLDYNYNEALAGARASWHSIPTTPSQAAAYAAYVAGDFLRNHGDKIKDILKTAGNDITALRGNKEAYDDFRYSYDDARDDLEQSYKHAKKAYKASKRWNMNTEEQALRYNRMKEFEKQLEEFTEEKYLSILYNEAIQSK